MSSLLVTRKRQWKKVQSKSRMCKRKCGAPRQKKFSNKRYVSAMRG